jgi:lipopolysaccharide cholinephosphotransferase
MAPRLLITLGDQCDFLAQELAQKIEAIVVRGSEEEMAARILEIDRLNLSHSVILDAPIQNLNSFASRLFYDSICLNEPWSSALDTLKAKMDMVPRTDADLRRISPEERGRFYDLMGKVASALDHKKIAYWAISGTLLGAARHGGMIPWDDDLDIIIRIEDKKRFESLARKFKAGGLQLYINSDYYYKIFPQTGTPIYREDGSTYPWKYPFLDVFVVNTLQEKIRIVSHKYSQANLYAGNGEETGGWWLYPHELQMPQNVLPFGPGQIPVPHDHEAILNREYGSDWKMVAYMMWDHSQELSQTKVKVRITDYSPPEYILPN